MALERKFYSGNDYRRALSIEELRGIGQRRIPNFAFEYLEGGAEDEVTLKGNRAAFDALRLVPSTLVDTSARHQRTTLFGRQLNSPLLIAPTGVNGILCHRGDVALARAASSAGIPFTLSMVSNVSLEEVAAEAGGSLWMQLYFMKDRGIVRDIVYRAEQAGYEALVFTSDNSVFGHREWDQRNYRGPAKLTLRNLGDVIRHPRWLLDVMVPRGVPKFENIIQFMPPEARGRRAGFAIPGMLAPDISWDDVAWLRQAWPRKLVLKGVLNVPDAIRAAELGCDGIVISNHGGRQLDCCVSPLEVLPSISQAVRGRIAVIVDSGFRRGTDVVKAIALGADAVMIGRAALYGLAAGGEQGACHALSILTTEIDRVIGQLGCRSLAEIGAHVLVQQQGPMKPATTE